MVRRSALRGLLGNFLATFVSRNSDHDGYWLLGQLPLDHASQRIDLLGAPPVGDAPLCVATRLAIQRLHEQLAQAGVDPTFLQEAVLHWTSSPSAHLGLHGGEPSRGHDVEFCVRAVTDLGRCFERRQRVFVAPHDPTRELRSTRWKD